MFVFLAGLMWLRCRRMVMGTRTEAAALARGNGWVREVAAGMERVGGLEQVFRGQSLQVHGAGLL